MFTTIPIIADAISDRFSTFLDYSNFIALDDPKNWIQRRYRDAFGQVMTFAHHDMSLPENQKAFERRAARFLSLREEDNALFVHIEYSDRIYPGHCDELRAAINRQFGASHLLLIGLGDPVTWGAGNTTVWNYRPSSPLAGTEFADWNDTSAVLQAIKDVAAATAGVSVVA